MYSSGDSLLIQPRLAGAARRLLAILGMAAVVLLVPVQAASAHDSLMGTTPENGQTLAEVPAEIELEFSSNPLGIGSKVIVEDQDGRDWAMGEVKIIDTKARQQISADAPAGTYTVMWRIVSSDSHPIEGSFEFTAESGGAGSPVSSGAAVTSAPEDQMSGNPASADQTEPGSFFSGPGVWIAGSVALLLLVALVILMGRRRRDTPPPA